MSGRSRERSWQLGVTIASVTLVALLIGQATFGTASASPSRVPAGVATDTTEETTPPTPVTTPETTPPTTPDTTPPTTPDTTPPTTPDTTPPTDPPTTVPPTTIPFSCIGTATTREAPLGDIRRVSVTDRSATRLAAVGTSKGASTKEVQKRLQELGFWLSAFDGMYGTTTSQAVMAFQKYIGLARTGKVDQKTADGLSCARFRGFSNVSQIWTLIEVDKGRQLLFVVKNGVTVSVLNTSTGSGKPYRAKNLKKPGTYLSGVAITPNGWHKVYWEWTDGWKPGELGRIYRPKYIFGGIAMHGMTSVPGYPASHGCIRLSLPAMDMIWKLGWVKKGTSVWVHE